MSALLELAGLHAWYGASHVLDGVDLSIGEGEVLALAGRNGSGRSTLAKAIMGLVQTKGDVRFRGTSIAGLRPFRIARRGIGYVPEQRDIFASLTVRENLVLGMNEHARRFTIDDAYRIFPVLRERMSVKAGVLSGGEQQMLALARTLVGDPELVIVDEPAEGLAPAVVRQVGDCLATLKQRGVAMLLIEQRMTIARALGDRVAVMGHGRIVFDGSLGALSCDERVTREWLSVGG
ncbi:MULTISPECIES: ABC transporter ATP-binding protein [unclassified Caballeronia]|uniref:ABC transporter ATP-binding protein n=1 Tax=unclassified Caballeronia TaxID=2646786 RepID=UPI00285989B6|nr:MULTISPECIES: ABC transporter ATP-binding protein [unclassified Caballeronia]MDR5751055.1 ABC transporter ATP-binding protein [Caballeronia sp. LZ024]MDR5844810.1 ABC transporter ATP-binding protein [Caballeronia sp. LZ031]